MDESMDIDPALAVQMGFSSFGGAPKKRKFDANDAVTDVDTAGKAQAPSQLKATGSNSQPLGQIVDRTSAMPSAVVASAEARTTTVPGEPSLQALRQGVRNEDGDMVYFLPSFLEDPWAGLK
ncbi:hypothetical protein LTR95_018158 [Oleoguttula sp. CCFEE 5521]|uniref:Uncharacterized protein n=1 Tax=Cryoendolithus antarcticus TaxID=1507870 RepID=A0A1V8TJQ6_9PEZI|nr:hypothetical protein B0A48_03340 [Cryoendolithus antarcticus]